MSISRRNRIVAILLTLSLFLAVILPVFSLGIFAEESRESGFIPSEKRTKYTATKIIESTPKTYEATVKIPTDFDTAYAIFSNYTNSISPSFTISVNSSGQPYISIYGGGIDNKSTVVFDEVDLRTGTKLKLAIVIDEENSLVNCYVDGVLASSKEATLPDATFESYMLVGGTYSVSSFLYGEIFNVALYSDIRSEEELISDATTAPSGDNMLCYYDFCGYDNSNPAPTIADLSENHNDLTLYSEFYDEPKIPVDDYAYSFAIVGDIQVVNIKYPENLHKIYDWIVDNADDKKIAFTFNLGDITDKNTIPEWERAYENIHKMDGIVPYSIVRGNHDRDNTMPRYEQYYDQYFKYEDYVDMVDGAYKDNMQNTYQTFEVAGNKYLVLNLDFKLDHYILAWANEVLNKHHDYNVIVTTHIYLDSDGKPLNRNDSLPANKYGAVYDGEQLWDNFLSKHENIELVISGHIGSSSIITTERVGDHGNVVTQILVDPQGMDGKYSGGLGLVAMLYFTEDGKIAKTQYYSTIREQYFLSGQNEYTIELDPIQYPGSEPIGHTFVLKSDTEKHWYECKCGEISGEELHTYGEWTVVREPSLEKRGQKKHVCTLCAYEDTEVIPKLTEDEEEEDIPVADEPKDTNYTLIIILASAGGVILLGGGAAALLVLKKRKSRKPIDTSENDEQVEE